MELGDPSGLNADVENTALERQKAAMRAAAVGAVSKGVNLLATRIAQELIWGILQSNSKPGDKADDAEEQGSSAAGQGNGDCNPAQEECDGEDTARRVAEAVQKVPSECLQNYKCKDFAEELSKRLKEEGVDHSRIKIESDIGRIYDNAGDQIISETRGTGAPAVHEGIRVGENIYDNIYPNGLPADVWLDNYGVGWPAGPEIVK